MQFAGHPLVGDPLYGKPHLASVFHRQALHAFRLGLKHPSTGNPFEWIAPLPDDMKVLLNGSMIPEKEQWYESDYS